MFEIPLNKFEKEKRVIELHKQGKTIRQIAPEVRMSFRNISNIIKAYERKITLEAKRKENKKSNQKPAKKFSLSSQAFKLLSDGKTPVQVAVDLNIDYPKIRKHWLEYIRLINMTKLFNMYIQNEYHLNDLFKIYYFMLRNEIPIKDCENVLKVSHEIAKMYQIRSNLKTEIEKLEQIKNNMHYSQYNQLAPLKPLPKPTNWNYQYRNAQF